MTRINLNYGCNDEGWSYHVDPAGRFEVPQEVLDCWDAVTEAWYEIQDQMEGYWNDGIQGSGEPGAYGAADGTQPRRNSPGLPPV